MADQSFTPGDVVELKSGGPDMTIQEPGDTGYWICVWFDGQMLNKRAFHTTTLKHIDRDRFGIASA
jgi:uncharacterized protein YodC (DUF2158 family)